MQKKTPDARPRSRWPSLVAAIGLVGAVILLATVWLVGGNRRAHPEEPLLERARSALMRGDLDEAEHLASAVNRRDREWVASRLVAGEAAMKAGRFEVALRYFDEIPRDGSPDSVTAALSTAEVARTTGQLTLAETNYRYVIEHQPGNAAAHERMAFLLGMTGRRWESQPHFQFLLRRGAASLHHLALLGDLERPMEQDAFLQSAASSAPDDVLVLLGLAYHDLVKGQTSEARTRLRSVVAQAPDIIAAQAMLGELLVDADDGTFAAWHSELPAAAEESADIWYVRGLWARRQNDLEAATRCFWETVRRVPSHRRGNYQLGQILIARNDPAGHEFTERARLLYELTQALDNSLRSGGRDEKSMRRVATILAETGRAWEAAAWAYASIERFPRSTWPRELIDRVAPILTDNSPNTLPSKNLALRHNYSNLPSLDQRLEHVPRAAASSASETTAKIRFHEETDVGIDFVHDNGADTSTAGARMFEQSGGAVSVLDFDLDGCPDLHFTQGGRWMQGELQPERGPDSIDRFYRNRDGKSFVDITHLAGVDNVEFAQGSSIGDVDGDGFPDLYVANIGVNRLYRNNGDGTFGDVTAGSGIAGETWTASCVVVDLNADGLPDLFDVTYVTGHDVYVKICGGKACSPNVFQGVPDRLWINRGDGTYRQAPLSAPAESSKGLGLIAADIGTRGRPSLVVANDQVPNHVLRNLPADDEFGVRLVDEGFATGLAFNEDGLAMACMGIAADDVDGNGLFDLYLTNFADESNTFYLQDSPGLFIDATNPAGLRAASFDYVGWGTQFLDADLDGSPDLVLANGHVDDFRDEGGLYRMRPQFFRNTGGGQFVELPSEEAGDYFGREFLGRGLARIDWNRDGRVDFAVSNIGDRASLVTNRSENAGHFLNVRLHATESARDAIGSVVSVAAGDRRWTKQLLAGDGYMATNERLLNFGLGSASMIDEMQIAWPSGTTTVLRDLPADITIELTENASRATAWRGGEIESLTVNASRDK